MMSGTVEKHLKNNNDVEEGHPNAQGDMVSVASSQYDHDSDNEGTTTTNSRDGKEESSEEQMELARKETTAVFRLRLGVFGVLLLAAIGVSITVYLIIRSAEQGEYVTQWEGTADKVKLAFTGIVDTKMSAISSLGVALIAHGRDHSTQSWPFVTLSSFQERASTAREQSGVLWVHMNPQVMEEERPVWEHFAANHNDSSWIEEGMEFQENVGLGWVHSIPANRQHFPRDGPVWPIWYYGGQDQAVADDTSGPVFPTWQMSPIIHHGLEVNENILANKDGLNGGAKITFESGSVAISQLLTAPPGDVHSDHPTTATYSLLVSAKAGKPTNYMGDPLSKVYFPIYDEFDESRKAVAIMLATLRWADYFIDILPSSLPAINIVLRDDCGGSFTYLIDGKEVFPIGEGDHHDKSFEEQREYVDFSNVDNIGDGTKQGLAYNRDFCPVSLEIYPTQAFYSYYNTSLPVVLTISIVAVFVFTAIMFIVYDRLVERRQALVMMKAAQTNAIVTSLFPANVRDRLLEQATQNQKNGSGSFVAPNRRLKGYLDGGQQDDEMDNMGTPIADLFPHCTVLFADISGFTAWSSTRDPAQVFILLQTVYQAFDKIAKARKVFKVETIGDSYVAVTGLPEPQPTHAVIMCRFASECRIKLNELTSRLENTLGPDTGDLSMRFGLHSGPVTAGVLMGDRARFQLFGDTVNTAARMESTGVPDKIQVSESTYHCLMEAGKAGWVKPRSEGVQAKGKGCLKTFFVDPRARAGSSTAGSSVSGDSTSGMSGPNNSSGIGAGLNIPTVVSKAVSASKKKKSKELCMKHDRLVNWISDMLKTHIRKVVAMRSTTAKPFKGTISKPAGQTSLDEVAEVIKLPKFCKKNFAQASNAGNVQLSDAAAVQLKEYVSEIAALYQENPFHNFEHACHVSMATDKLLKRIVSPDLGEGDDADIGNALHDYTHGINSDPLTHLAIIFSALVHDADHRGVSNPQLAIENKELAAMYHNKSIAEQHSLDQAWDLFMEPRFEELRACIFTNQADMKRFRQVMVNVVLATDIFDIELNNLRKKRWERAFSSDGLSHEENNDLRATIVIEHIIQASDVSHTMQHWHIYRKWNKNLFTEMYTAYREGRMAKDPSTFWYRGEIGFFDNYVIPLAKKLKDCNVFGVSSDECLNYAIQNRNEWEAKGAAIVEEMMQELSFQEFPDKTVTPVLTDVSTAEDLDDDEADDL